MDYEDSDTEDAKMLRQIADRLESEWAMCGISSGLYFEWAAEIAVRFHAAKISANAELSRVAASEETK
jgi:hypothetical protein